MFLSGGIDSGGGGASEDEEGEGGNKNPWDPFETEAEWRFASWAIQEGIKLSSIDRFLDIPGVSLCFERSWKLGTQYLMYSSEKN